MNRLGYRDEMIIFSSTDLLTLQLVRMTLRNYEKTSSQKNNKEKSSAYMHQNVTRDISITVQVTTNYWNRKKGFHLYIFRVSNLLKQKKKGFI